MTSGSRSLSGYDGEDAALTASLGHPSTCLLARGCENNPKGGSATCLGAPEGSKCLSHSLSRCFTFCGLTHTPCGVAGRPKAVLRVPHHPSHAAAFLRFSRQLPSSEALGNHYPLSYTSCALTEQKGPVWFVRSHIGGRWSRFQFFVRVKKAAPNVCVLVCVGPFSVLLATEGPGHRVGECQII